MYHLHLCRAPVVALLSTFAVVSLHAADTDFFERKIRPVLVEHCYECHSAESDFVQGGLRVDDPGAMVRGGDSGAAVTPGKPHESLLLAALRYQQFEMPPNGRLDEQIIRDFETWIKNGAVAPDDPTPVQPVAIASETASIDWDQARSFWAFQPPQLTPPPPPNNSDASSGPPWALGPIDRFVQSRLDQAGLQPNPPADRRTLIRRLSLDLIGLPPTPEQVAAFLADTHPAAVDRVVDRLLASPQHAERWARLWLDVARYAEDQAHIVGNNDSLTYPNAYLYRDWVIAALAADMPYDEFVRYQLAADLIHPDDTDAHVALGFLGLGPKYYARGSLEVMADEWEDRVDTVSRGLLGLTVACARCHDHKYDPIPTADYYALAGVFASTDMYNQPLDEKVETKGDQAAKPQDAVHIVREGKVQDLQVMIRGDAKRLGEKVPRSFLKALGSVRSEPFSDGSGRRELAEAIVGRQNPLAARVIVNRVWDQLTGAPLVGTPSNFGALGDRPTHPELLDHLAVGFMHQGWSLKWLQRQIVLSATYQQSSQIDDDKAQLDPENQLRWRMHRRRLSVEAYRDAVLAVSGNLQSTVGGESIQPDAADSRRRTVYSEISRLDLNPMLARFDFPDPNAHSERRFETTTPLQKLFLLNSPFLVAQADALATRLTRHGGSIASRVDWAYQLLFSRPATLHESELAESFLVTDTDAVWSQYCQALLISNEMLMVD